MFLGAINNIKLKITEGLLIALLPVFGYFSAYSYEDSYLTFYGVGNEFINISLNSIITSTIGLLVFLIIAASLAELFYPIIIQFNPNNPVHKRLRISFLLLTLGLLTYRPSDAGFTFLKILLPILLLIFTLFIEPAFRYRKENISYIEKMTKRDTESKEKSLKDRSFFKEIFINTSLRPMITILVITLFLVSCSAQLGMVAASMQEGYFVYTKNSDSFIIIRSNNGEKIAVGVDLSDKSLTNNYLIINSDLKLTYIHTGRLSNYRVKQNY